MANYQYYFTLIGQYNPELEDGLKYMPLFYKERRLDLDEMRSIESDMQAVLLDSEEKEIIKMPLSYGYYCNDPGYTIMAVRGYLPYTPQTAEIRFLFGKKVIDRLRVSKEKPEIAITSEMPEELPTGKYLLTWSSSYQGKGSLQYKVLYSNDGGERWQRIGDRTTEEEMEINTSELAGGKNGVFKVQVTDGYNNASAEIGGFKVPYKPNEVLILSPGRDDSFSADREVFLNGQCYNPNTGAEVSNPLEWSSSIDGKLGEGEMVMTKLKPGRHVIKLAVGTANSQVEIFVE